jgi:hypothetical protein
MAKKLRNWKVVVIGDMTYEGVKAATPEDAVKKTGAVLPEGWETSVVGNTVIISPPIKLG